MFSGSGAGQRQAPWVVVAPPVLVNGRLSAGEKIVYGRVFGFIEKFGYCRASNEYLGKYIGMSKNTIRNYLSKLYELGYLRYELIRDDKREVVERRIYSTLIPPGVLPRTSPSTRGGTKEITVYDKKNVDSGKKDDSDKVEYYAGLLADTLDDTKSISFYRLACRRNNPQRLLEKAKEIISDGGARNPAAVFAAWLKEQLG